jgi:hypothetical protein
VAELPPILGKNAEWQGMTGRVTSTCLCHKTAKLEMPDGTVEAVPVDELRVLNSACPICDRDPGDEN